MPTTTEHIAIEALRQIAQNKAYDPALVAKLALEQIDRLNSPEGNKTTVHNLSADDVIIDKPPGGGL